ncbi:hypothetical protein HY469_02805, partial [Candidatus Roizmanbacteria bacterium]|nr:hypothetical protein [Candidatus Roizmanbacteria bacterium]
MAFPENTFAISSSLKLFGQKSLTETARDTISGHGIYHAAGVVVDKTVTPNRLYIADTGNSRILGYKSLGACAITTSVACTADTDCTPITVTPAITIPLTTPSSCTSGGGTCWDTQYTHPDYTKTHLLQATGTATFQNITISPDMKLEFAYYDNNHSFGNGYYVKVSINTTTIWTSPLVAPPDHEVPKVVSINLSQYAGQTVTITLETDRNGDGFGDDAIIADPVLTNQKKNTCIIDPDKDADIVIGQPDFESGACNRDNLEGIYKNPTSTSLCLMTYPLSPNIAENWGRLNFDVDAQGNLYVPDIYNNRVLVYNQPFSKQTKTNIAADYVIGQPSFTANQINHGLGINTRDASGLYIGIDPADGKFGVMARGTSVDPQGNIWVADTYNSRLLRFPKKVGGGYEQQADLVIGQSNFTLADRFNCNKSVSQLNPSKICAPIVARVHPVSGELYVLDQINVPGQYFYTVILVYTPQQGNFVSGQAADRTIVVKQPSPFDPWNGWSVEYMPQFTSFQFNTSSVPEYTNGTLWLMEHEAKRLLLINNNGDIIAVINAPNTAVATSNDATVKYRRGGELKLCISQFADTKYKRFCPSWPGGSFGFDNAENVYLADEAFHRIVRYALPFSTVSVNGFVNLPRPNGGFYTDGQPNIITASHFSESGGTTTYQGQLIVRDRNRYLVWNNYLNRSLGEKADYVVGQANEFEIVPNDISRHAFHTIDEAGHMWTYDIHGRLTIFQLPFTGNNPPLKAVVPLYWKDDPTTAIDFQGNTGIVFDEIH